MKINRIFMLAGSILFIAAIIVWVVSCATKPVSQPSEKTAVSSQKAPAAAVQLPLPSTATSVTTLEALPSKPVAEETIKIEKTPTITNTIGPVPDSATQVKSQPLPVFRPLQNYTGPTPVIENTVTTQQSTATDNQITGFNPENVPVLNR